MNSDQPSLVFFCSNPQGEKNLEKEGGREREREEGKDLGREGEGGRGRSVLCACM